MVTRATLSTLLMPIPIMLLTSCEQRAPQVYVLESPQSITLTASASPTSVQQGGTVVLRVARRTSGKWKQVSRDELKAGQCWVYRPPPESEDEVAHDVQWAVVPENAVRFNTDYQMDRTRGATMMVKGTIELTPVSTVKCEGDRVVEGASIHIEVS